VRSASNCFYVSRIAMVVDEDTAEPYGNFVHSRHQHQAFAICDITQHPFEAVRSKFAPGERKESSSRSAS
jgi:hypothetical protein